MALAAGHVPIRRRAGPPLEGFPATTVVAGTVVIVGTVVLLTLMIDSSSESNTIPVVPAPDTETVLRAVGAAAHITSLPNPIRPSVTAAADDFGGNYENPELQCGSPTGDGDALRPGRSATVPT